MVRSVLGRNPGGVRTVLDSAVDRCAPCSVAPVEDLVVAEVTGRVIVRHRTRTGIDAEGVAEYGWSTVYDGPGVWSALLELEDDDGSGALTQAATVTIGAMDVKLETTASVWDEDRRRWDVVSAVTDPTGGLVIDVTRRVDADGSL